MSESKQWRPSKWTDRAIKLRLKRVFRRALQDMNYMIGPYNAALVYAQFVAEMKSEQSRAMLQQMGIPLLGEKPLDI